MTLDQINVRLEELKTSKSQVQGLETEVYARIVGYYRSVRNWNQGKKEEYSKRLNYTSFSDERPGDATSVPSVTSKAVSQSPAPLEIVQVVEPQRELTFSADTDPVSYLYFFRRTCPNCPPLAAWVDASGLEGRKIDVDRESGMHEAARFDITAAPTVILLNAAGNEVGRGNTVSTMDAIAGLTAVAGA